MSRFAAILREERGRPDTISHRTGIPIERIHALLGGAEATLPELRQIAKALKRPLEDFLTEPTEDARVAFLFRYARTDPKQTSAASRLSRKLANCATLLTDVLPQGDWWRDFDAIDQAAPNAAEEGAALFRSRFFNDDQLGPIVSLPQIGDETLGLLVFVISTSDIEGASALYDDFPFAFVAARFKPRMLFTLAHEIGHILFHNQQLRETAVLDRGNPSFEAERPRQGHERVAHAFASALLLPARGVGVTLQRMRRRAAIDTDELGDIEIAFLARIYGVSFLAAARRCEDLDLLPRGGAISLHEEIVRRFGSPEKRAAALRVPERPSITFTTIPSVIVRTLRRKIRNGDISLGRAARMFDVSVAELMSLIQKTAS